MLLTNWLRSISNRCRSPHTRYRNLQRRTSPYASLSRSCNSENRQLNTIESLEDRTMLTSVFTIDDIIFNEGDAGLTSAVFTVTRTGANAGDLNEEVSVDYVTLDDTATRADGDYFLATGSLTFAADPTALSQTQTFSVLVAGESVLELDETFQVLIANNTGNTTIADSSATATINNDDFVYLSFQDITVNESDGYKSA